MKKITSFFFILLVTSLATSQNLILNPSAEEPLVNGEIPSWTETISDDWQYYTHSDFGQGVPTTCSGSNMFFSGWHNVNDIAELAQIIDISSDATDIDLGIKHYYFSGYTIAYSQTPPDESNFIFELLDENNSILSTITLGPFNTTSWNLVEQDLLAPINSRKIKIKLHSKRNTGAAGDGAYDQLYLGHSQLSDPCSLLEIDSIESTEFSIYPSPTTGIINIANQENLNIDKIEILDVLGKIVATKMGNSSQIDISALVNGIYLLKIYAGTTVIQKKIIKQ